MRIFLSNLNDTLIRLPAVFTKFEGNITRAYKYYLQYIIWRHFSRGQNDNAVFSKSTTGERRTIIIIPACILRSVLRILRDDKIIGLRIENKNCVTQRLRRLCRVFNTNKQKIWNTTAVRIVILLLCALGLDVIIFFFLIVDRRTPDN
jgi:hypothetical protein